MLALREQFRRVRGRFRLELVEISLAQSRLCNTILLSARFRCLWGGRSGVKAGPLRAPNRGDHRGRPGGGRHENSPRGSCGQVFVCGAEDKRSAVLGQHPKHVFAPRRRGEEFNHRSSCSCHWPPAQTHPQPVLSSARLSVCGEGQDLKGHGLQSLPPSLPNDAVND
jgi:hypothetical protein